MFNTRRRLLSSLIDFKKIRDNLDAFKVNCKNRSCVVDVDEVVEKHRVLSKRRLEYEELRHKQKVLSQSFLHATKDNIDSLRLVLSGLKGEIAIRRVEMEDAERDFEKTAAELPNWSSLETPIDAEPKLIQYIGCRPDLTRAKDHLDIAGPLNLIDFENAAKSSRFDIAYSDSVTGQKFYFLQNELALMESAISLWAMSEATRRGWEPLTTPDLARVEVAEGCGYRPRSSAYPTPLLTSSVKRRKSIILKTPICALSARLK
jgi:seryl-tRNA synthetase